MRSLRTVYSAINSEAFNKHSGGIEGRPTSLYICSNSGESSLSATSASALISLIGWLVGTRFSGFTKVSIVLCGRSYPRIFLFLFNPTGLAPLYNCETTRRSLQRGIFQHPVRLRLLRSASIEVLRFQSVHRLEGAGALFQVGQIFPKFGDVIDL